MSTTFQTDLVVLVPGRDDAETIGGLLSSRTESLGIRPVRYRVLVHPRHDPGCFLEAPAVLQPFQRSVAHALVLFDHEGSGQELRPGADVAQDLRDRLTRAGWADRAEVVLLQPELEIWVWSDSPEVDAVLGWRGRYPTLREWLQAQGFWAQENDKPNRPKEALRAALRQVSVQRSSAIYRQLAERVSLERCQDEAFRQMRTLLAAWFPEGPQAGVEVCV